MATTPTFDLGTDGLTTEDPEVRVWMKTTNADTE